MNAVAVEKAGIASGVLSMFRMVGGSLGVAVTGAIFQASVGTANFAQATPQDFVDALSQAMAVSAVVALAGAAFAAVAIRAKRKPLSQAEAEGVLARSSDPAGQVEAASQL
jgi:Na+/melibiose symporter-like transporter